LTGFIFNPLIFLISSSLVVASQTASFIVNTGFMGAILYFSKKKLFEIPLPYPLSLLSYRSKEKIQRICIAGSLNEDKGLTEYLHAASLNPKLNFAILCTDVVALTLTRSNTLPGNVQIHSKRSLVDSDIYEFIASSTHIYLPYGYITQSGVLPIAQATSVTPILPKLPGFLLYSENVKDLLFIDDASNLSKLLDDSPHSGSISDQLFNSYVDSQVKALTGLGLLLNLSQDEIELAKSKYQSFIDL
jgi:hypothetical protein